MMKNEAQGLDEWLQHYLSNGVDAVLLLDNGSDDESVAIALRFAPRVHVHPAPRRHYQERYYNELAVPWLSEQAIDILAVLDVDEFLFSRDGRPLKAALHDLFSDAATALVWVRWSCFGSSGHVHQPESVRGGFTWRFDETKSAVPYANDGAAHACTESGKSIVRVSALRLLKVHLHVAAGALNMIDRYDPGGLQLNHYAIQSSEWFSRVKMRRGAADYYEFENVSTFIAHFVIVSK